MHIYRYFCQIIERKKLKGNRQELVFIKYKAPHNMLLKPYQSFTHLSMKLPDGSKASLPTSSP